LARQLEVRILNQTDQIAKWVRHRGHFDPVADIPHGGDDRRAGVDEVLEGTIDRRAPAGTIDRQSINPSIHQSMTK